MPREPYTRHPANRDPKYLQWIRAHGCIVPGCKARYCEAAHVGPRALGRKVDDHETLPICLFHHRTAKFSFHGMGRWGFEACYKLDLGKLIEEFKQWYAMERGE